MGVFGGAFEGDLRELAGLVIPLPSCDFQKDANCNLIQFRGLAGVRSRNKLFPGQDGGHDRAEKIPKGIGHPDSKTE